MKDQILEARIGALLNKQHLTICAAESCTGGLILHRLTNVSGSSAYVMGGFVTYSNQAKIRFAHVAPQTLATYGAVSEQTAIEMARGTRQAFGADLAMSVTGIAGPGGGTPDKPVGLTYIALSAAQGEQVVRHVWPGDREANKAASAEAALQMLLEYLGGQAGQQPEQMDKTRKANLLVNFAIYEHLKVLARQGETTTYGEIAPLAHLDLNNPADLKEIGTILDDIAAYEFAQNHPLLSALVVSRGKNIPGRGFFKSARELGVYQGSDDFRFFTEELRRVHDYWKKA
jgi:nicotinamide-nucleotide amidase